jgi:hypothetical protein
MEDDPSTCKSRSSVAALIAEPSPRRRGRLRGASCGEAAPSLLTTPAATEELLCPVASLDGSVLNVEMATFIPPVQRRIG